MKKKNLVLVLILLLACVLPVCADGATPIRDNGQLTYSTADSTKSSYGLRPWGHAVFFENKVPIVVDGVRLYAYRYGDLEGEVRIEIWDENLTRLYRDVIAYEKLPLHQSLSDESDRLDVISWQNIPIPGHLVTGNFYLVIFTDSYAPKDNKHGISIGFTTPSTSATSHTVKSGPNRIDEITMNLRGTSFPPTDVDWMIRVLYSPPVATTTVQATTPLKGKVKSTISVQTPVQTSPVSTQGITSPQPSPASTQGIPSSPLAPVPTPTKSAMEIPVIILTIVLSLCVFRRV
jgi:hypothetical protein